MNRPRNPGIGIFWPSIATFLVGCAANPQAAIFDTASALEARSYQTRVLETADREATLRAVIATLQDLGFVLDGADATLGSVTATKLQHYRIRITVTVRPRNATQLLVRANAEYSEPVIGGAAIPIEDPAAYQDFFQALERSAFLAARQLE